MAKEATIEVEGTVIDSIKDNKIHDRNIFKESEKQFEILDKYILG